jgi:hypothetical protein
VLKSLEQLSFGPVGLLHTQNLGIKLEKPLAKLMQFLSEGRLLAEGVPKGGGRSVPIPRSIWQRDGTCIDLDNGDLLEINARAEDDSAFAADLHRINVVEARCRVSRARKSQDRCPSCRRPGNNGWCPCCYQDDKPRRVQQIALRP